MSQPKDIYLQRQHKDLSFKGNSVLLQKDQEFTWTWIILTLLSAHAGYIGTHSSLQMGHDALLL